MFVLACSSISASHKLKFENLGVFERGENLLQYWLQNSISNFTIVRNRVGKVEFEQAKNRLQERNSG